MKQLIDKILVEKTREGRKDGAYSRLLGDEELGALISRIHATSISAGTFLENYIVSVAPSLPPNDIPKIFDNSLKEGIFLINKKIIKQYITIYLNMESVIEPDYIIVDCIQHFLYVIELKDGDNFDTKKSKGEVQNLKTYSKALANKVPYPWKIQIKVCMFNQNDKTKIVSGFKSCITETEAMSGEEFSRLLSINKADIDKQRSLACEKNIDFVIDELLHISVVSRKIHQKLTH